MVECLQHVRHTVPSTALFSASSLVQSSFNSWQKSFGDQLRIVSVNILSGGPSAVFQFTWRFFELLKDKASLYFYFWTLKASSKHLWRPYVRVVLLERFNDEMKRNFSKKKKISLSQSFWRSSIQLPNVLSMPCLNWNRKVFFYLSIF